MNRLCNGGRLSDCDLKSSLTQRSVQVKGTLTVDRILTPHSSTDLQTQIAAQADAIVANTAKVGISAAQANAIVANAAKVGISAAQANAIVANTAKVGITTAQAFKLNAQPSFAVQTNFNGIETTIETTATFIADGFETDGTLTSNGITCSGNSNSISNLTCSGNFISLGYSNVNSLKCTDIESPAMFTDTSNALEITGKSGSSWPTGRVTLVGGRVSSSGGFNISAWADILQCHQNNLVSRSIYINYLGGGVFCGSVQVTSDGRLKENQRSVPNSVCTNIFNQIELKQYERYKDMGTRRSGGGTVTRVGFIAQDVQNALPDGWNGLVSSASPASHDGSDEDPIGDLEGDILHLDYGRLVTVLWGVVKEQGRSIAALEARLTALE